MRIREIIPLLCLVTVGYSHTKAMGQEPLDGAWKRLPHYEYGQDLAELLTIEQAVIHSMGSPPARTEIAAKLADSLQRPETTQAAKQFICLQLRQVGTSDQVPVLAALLNSPDTSDMARYALAAIPGEAARDALRDALNQLRGKPLVGVINTLGMQQDLDSVGKLIELAETGDSAVRVACLRALGSMSDSQALEFLRAVMARQEQPLSSELAACLLNAARQAEMRGDRQAAASVFNDLSSTQQKQGVRRAALEGLLALDRTQQSERICDWFLKGDSVEQQVAAQHLDLLPDEMLNRLAGRINDLPESSRMILIDVLARREHEDLLAFVMEMVDSKSRDVQLAGLRCLGDLHQPAAVSVLIDHLSADEQVSSVAQHSLERFPRELVGPTLTASLARSEIRVPVIAVLKKLKYYESIDALIDLASSADPAVYNVALDGLRSIADPDEYDLPRLLRLLDRTVPGGHRDEVEKTIAVVCNHLPVDQDRAQPVLDLLKPVPGTTDGERLIEYLPLLGRLGGDRSLQLIQEHLRGQDADANDAAVRAICNWPNADVAELLWSIVQETTDKRHRRWALRAFVRVISLPSERPASETLTLLQTAMRQAEEQDDRSLIVERAGNVRTIECARWVAGYLDDEQIAPSACRSIVELAHHRELRHPNLNEFRPWLEKVARISSDPQVVEGANRYQLGL